MKRSLKYCCGALTAVLLILPLNPADAFRHGLSVGTSVKLNAFGSSNATDGPGNNNRSFITQSLGLFKSDITVVNTAVAFFGAKVAVDNFDNYVAIYYDATKTINILSVQFSGTAEDDITANPASVATYYNNMVTIAQRWKALGVHTKVVIFTPNGFQCTSQAMADNMAAANALLIADHTNFDAVISTPTIASFFTPSTNCPPVDLVPDCTHLSETGSTLFVAPYVTAVNGVF